MRVASAQVLIVGGDPVGNLERAVVAVRDATKLGADFVVLPECSNFGWADSSAIKNAVEVQDDPFVIGLQNLAKELGIYIAVGFVEKLADALFNSAVLIDAQGQIVIHHRKINELDFAKEIYSTGSDVFAVDTPFGKVGLMICADALSGNDMVVERLVELGTDVILSPSAWAVPPTHDNTVNPYGSLWVDAYRKGLGSSKSWIVATSNVGVMTDSVWTGFPCIGNSIAIGPAASDLIVSPFGQSAVHIELIEIRQTR